MLALVCGVTVSCTPGEQGEQTRGDELGERSFEEPVEHNLDELTSRIAGLDQQIRSMIGMAYADNLEQCRLAEIGHRPCGGPQYYMAYSTTALDEEALLELIAEHRALQTRFQQENDIVGTCEVLPRPQLTLQGGRCVASPTAER
ncbi:hypothetical protein ACFOD1_03105 [Pseudidiomarina halophila]